MKTKLAAIVAVAIGGTVLLAAMNEALPQNSDTQSSEVAALKAEIAELRGAVPSQSHAMMDVDYHFANLWFAAQKANWPLANFYLNETKSHLNWTVRLHPVRTLANGQDLLLAPILKAVEQTGLAQLKAAIDNKNHKEFVAAYRETIAECYGCHRAAEKPFLRPQIPERAATQIINMQPDARWP